MARTMFEKALGIIPRAKLDELAKDFGHDDRPWQLDRKNLEAHLVAQDSPELRDELAEYLERTICATVRARQ